MKTIITVIFASLLVFIGAGECIADSITLRPSVRLASSAKAVRLADIADLEGSEAQALAALEIAPLNPPGTAMQLSLWDIRAKLNDAGVHWGHVNLSGSSVVVRLNRDPGCSPPMAMAPASINTPSRASQPSDGRDDFLAADLVGLSTMRGAVANLIVSNLRLNSQQVRLVFDASDASLLDMSSGHTRFEIKPLSSFASDRIELSVRAWEGGAVVESRTVTVRPKICVMGASLQRDVPKHHVIDEGDLVEIEQWESPGLAAQAVSRVSAIGRVASQPMKSGDIVRTRDVRSEALVRRGDMTTVRCFVGGAVLSLIAEATTDGSEGDIIEFRKQGEREAFRATVTGRRDAVIDLSRKSGEPIK